MKKKNKKKYMFAILLLLIAGISIGYAALTTTLNINGTTTIEKASWDVHFENLEVTDGSVTATKAAAIDSDITTINYEIILEKPGDFYEFTVDMVNAGTIDAMISEILKEGLTAEQEKYISYTVDYLIMWDTMQEKDILSAGGSESIKVRVEYRSDIEADDLPTEETSLALTFKVIYVQDDGTSHVVNASPNLHC